MAEIKVSCPFNLRLMLLSHGWVELAPFQWSDRRRALDAVVRLDSGRALALRITSRRECSPGQTLRFRPLSMRSLTAGETKELHARVRWMFRLDEDLTPFHEACRHEKGLDWVARFGLGRFLRTPTLFEEFTKVLLTTNVNWAGTKQMVNRLLECFGDPVDAGEGVTPDTASMRAFPAPEAIAGASEAELRKRCRLGYRAPYLLELAESIASGALRLEDLLDPSIETDVLAKSLGRLKGYGPYAVNVLLASLGRYDRLALDSWIRKMVAKRHFKGPRVSDRTIERFYAPWGEWKMLACWFDVMHETPLQSMLAEECEQSRPNPNS